LAANSAPRTVGCVFRLRERKWHVEIRAMVNTIVDGAFRQTNL